MTKVTLTKPLAWGNETITEIALRRPTAGNLRGIKLTAISELDVTTIITLVPRLSLTPLAPDALNALDPADLLSLCVAVAGFFEASSTPSPTTP